MSAITVANRVFRMGSINLTDPDPKLPPEEVKNLFAVNYPQLAASEVETPFIEGTQMVYTFKPIPVKTKG